MKVKCRVYRTYVKSAEFTVDVPSTDWFWDSQDHPEITKAINEALEGASLDWDGQDDFDEPEFVEEE